MAHGRSEIEHLIACVMKCSLSNSYLNAFGRQTERDHPLVRAACHGLRLSKKEFFRCRIFIDCSMAVTSQHTSAPSTCSFSSYKVKLGLYATSTASEHNKSWEPFILSMCASAFYSNHVEKYKLLWA